jgi:hypothetical protein
MVRKALAGLAAALGLSLCCGCANCGQTSLRDWLPWNRTASREREIVIAPGCEGPTLNEAGPFLVGPSGQGPFPPPGADWSGTAPDGSTPVPFPRIVPQPQAQPAPATASKRNRATE